MKPPKNSKVAFTGVLFNVYQWNQKMYDGSIKTFEMISRKSSVDVIATVGDQIMVLMQKQPTKPLFPSLPGGRVEEGQTPRQAALAELLQETGYKAEKMKLMAEFYGDSKLFYHESVFIAKNCRKVSEQNLDGGEKIKMTLCNYDQFLQVCRNNLFAVPLGLKFMMYEALIDKDKYAHLRKIIFL